MLQNDYLVAKIGVDPAENEPRKECNSPSLKLRMVGTRPGLPAPGLLSAEPSPESAPEAMPAGLSTRRKRPSP